MDNDYSIIFPKGHPVLVHEAGEPLKTLERDFEAWSPFGIVTVPAGFMTDGFSIPQLLWPLVGSPWNRFAPAAIVHDYLYTTKGLDGAWTRKDADKTFKWLLNAMGMNEYRSRIMYRGVRIGGGSGWGG